MLKLKNAYKGSKLSFKDPGSGGTQKRVCADGIDNDFDNLIDLSDPSCSSADDNDESDGSTTPTGKNIFFEAEVAVNSIFTPFSLKNNHLASGGQYVVSVGKNGTHILEYPLFIDSSAKYSLWVRVLTLNSASDSFISSIDNKSKEVEHLGRHNKWEWVNFRQVKLNAGSHTLRIKKR